MTLTSAPVAAENSVTKLPLRFATQMWLPSEVMALGWQKVQRETLVSECGLLGGDAGRICDPLLDAARSGDADTTLALCAAGMGEAAKQFRKVNGFLHLPALRKTLDAYVAAGVTPVDYNKEDAA
jgi:hypothetical protein